MAAQDRLIDIGIKLHVREWAGDGVPFVLLHGLSSNSLTWQAVAERLAAAGHRVLAVDQRGHGLSDKPDSGYDFATITADLARLLDVMQLHRPIVAGQSWGGNVMLAFGATYPGRARGLGFIDGGFIDLRARPDATWEDISVMLKPPELTGMPRATLKQHIQEYHPDWGEDGVEATLGNFETLPDATVRPWLTLERHMLILRAMWDQTAQELYPLVTDPVLICVADRGNPEWTAIKHQQVAVAQEELPHAEVHWFENTDHDIHVHRPDALAELFLRSLREGIWA